MAVRRLLLFAGPNGSGKSTITTPENLKHFGIPADRYINADDIARSLLAEQPELPQEEREREAFRRARSLRQTYRDEGLSFAFETVFSHPSTLLDMAKCRAAGFDVVVLFVTTDDPSINVARVARRVRSGGHDVPEGRIRQRYERTMTLLPRIVEDTDRAYIYDNSGDTFSVFPFIQGVAAPTSVPIPLFLHARLVEPLKQREAERRAIADTVGTTIQADEEGASYRGMLLWSSRNYLVQAVESNRVLHDRLLVSADAQVGDTRIITYREGAGIVTE